MLSSLQERAVWEEIIRPGWEDQPLLDIPGAARRGSEAWQIAHAYEIPIRGGDFQASDDSDAFLTWAREYEQTLRDNHWLDAAQLPTFLLKRIAAGEIPAPSGLFHAGFDDLAPLTRSLFRAFRAQPLNIPRHEPRRREMLSCADTLHEIEAAAAWARFSLEEDPRARIGVVVPDLTASRAMVHRVFQRILDPRPFSQDSAAFHISLGLPLASYPVVHVGLAILQTALSHQALPVPLAGTLLRSPFLEGGEEESSARATLDADIRRWDALEISLSSLRSQAAQCPILQRIVGSLLKHIAELPEKQTFSEWSTTFASLLKSMGWPGTRSLGSAEFQIAEAWRSLLGDFASLDQTQAPQPFDGAFEALRLLASETTFQTEDPGAPVQIMGALEAAGLRFDRLWILGLHGAAFPGPARPNPFLPLSLQIRHGVPHSSPAIQLDFARGLLDSLTHSAPDLTLSYPTSEGEQSLRPTPLIPGAWEPAPAQGELFSGAPVEEILDETAPALAPFTIQRGGVYLLKQMAACPFRAFAEFRLGAAGVEDGEMGLSARSRGSGVHKALEIFWAQTQTHAELKALTDDALQERIRQSVEQALERQKGNLVYRLECARLENLLWDWLEIEKQREPFRVLASEEPLTVEFAGLKLKTRVDRIDELSDGRKVVLDYKTGLINIKGWQGDRMAEPQLPAYCCAQPETVAGVAFAQLQTGNLGFAGVAEKTTLPEMRQAALETDGLKEETALWRGRLESLAKRFLAGSAEVDPHGKACAYCPLPSLCRIHSSGVDEETDDAG